MHIRRAQLDELPILENLARQIWPDTYAQIISQEQINFMLDWMYSFPILKQQQEEGHEFYIIATEGTDIGFMALEWIHDAQQSGSVQLKINKLYVLHAFQGKGIGRQLMEHMEETARNKGCKETILHAREIALPFYEKLGYRSIERMLICYCLTNSTELCF
jgi:GNAT superfamily N-acetyltransferase